MVIALAGRRVDGPGTGILRFPAVNALVVKEKIREFFVKKRVKALVCAAACGADILALEVAGDLGLRRRIVLPYDKEIFKQSSVIDRPGDWGERFDRIVSEVESKGELIVYSHEKDKEETYFATNRDILDQAVQVSLSIGCGLGALVVWNGESRGDSDVTGDFMTEAKRRGLPVLEITTI